MVLAITVLIFFNRRALYKNIGEKRTANEKEFVYGIENSLNIFFSQQAWNLPTLKRHHLCRDW